MAHKQYQCDDCSASFDKMGDADEHHDNTGHFVYEAPPQNASDRERQAMGFEPRPEPTEGHVNVVNGERVGRRRADY